MRHCWAMSVIMDIILSSEVRTIVRPKTVTNTNRLTDLTRTTKTDKLKEDNKRQADR
jgi:hypothetical protein